MKTFFKDLFMGLGNEHWELARIIGTFSVTSYVFAFIYSLVKNHAELDFSALGIGFAALLGGVGILIYAKDSARTNAVSQVTQDATANRVSNEPKEVTVINPPSDPVNTTLGNQNA